MAELIEGDVDKVTILGEIAQSFFKVGHKQKAMTIIHQAVDFSVSIKDRKVKTLALSQVAQVLTEIEDKPHAVEIIKDALTISEPIEDKYEKGYALTSVMQSLFVMKELTLPFCIETP